MIRALYMAVGIVCLVSGLVLLGVERVELRTSEVGRDIFTWMGRPGDSQELEIPEHLPWGLMAGGTMVLLFSLTRAGKPKKAPAAAAH